MDPEQLAQWQAADALFDQWLDLPEAERAAWLAAQQPQPRIRQRLQQLIAAHQRPRAGFAQDSASLAGVQLGDWTLEEELGRGGMAVVYRAWREQGMARQQAALKILTLGALGAAGRERFQREAEILARLNHPNLTALVDSGVSGDGTCWLAMPLVEGQRIDAWCEAQALDAQAIVRLYLQVCGAVAYAHRNLVIHRDIKPSNVLVDGGGHVRLLDFGIGRFADPEGERTQTLWRALTPGYAAPEQLRGDPPSTAVDVYGLGALLHRLLTGRTPHAATGTETTRPSLLVRDAADACHRHYVPLKNDLDRVLLKALAEEPEQRYATAEALADDLRRWLDGQPVLAEKPGLGYRLRKFAARNRMGVAAGVLLAASLAGGIGATLWQAGEARHEAGNARAQAQRAILVRDFLAHVFQSTEPAAGGVPTALDLLDEGARRARSDILQTDPLAAADILMLTGKARFALNQIEPGRADLEQAAGLFASGGQAHDGARAVIEGELSSLLRAFGKTDQAIQRAQAAVTLGERSLATSGDPGPLVEARIRLAEATFSSDPRAATAMLEDVIRSIGEYGLEDTRLHLHALASLSVTASIATPDDHEKHLAIAEALVTSSPRVHGPESGAHVATLANQAQTFLLAGDHARAEQLATEAVGLAGRIYRQPHSRTALASCSLATVLQKQSRHAEALPLLEVATRTYSDFGVRDLSADSCYRAIGHARLALGDYAGAILPLQQSWEILVENDMDGTLIGHVNCGLRATARIRMNDPDGAAAVLAECPPGNDGETASPTRLLAQAELHLARGDLERAAVVAAEARSESPPEAGDAWWTRAWMLSELIAREMGHEQTRATLRADLGSHTARKPLAHCLAGSTRESCLTLP